MKKLKFIILTILLLFVIIPNVNAAISISPLKYELTIEQGKTVTKTIKVKNEGDSPMTLYTSSEDFISGDSTGQPKFLKPEDQDNNAISLANWVNIKEKNITLAIGETREIDFDIKVPKTGEPGGHYGAIFFSPGVIGDGKVAFSQRIGMLLLIDVPGKTIIDGTLESFNIGILNNDNFKENNSFIELPIIFQINFKNNGNIHLKPKGKIELIDEDGNILKNIGKETITSPTGTYVGEKMVDYIPINDIEGNVLPKSNRTFISKWDGFGYTILKEDGTKSVLFKNLNDYYADKASEKQKYLMFREQIHTKEVTKKITANLTLSYKSKDIIEKEFKKTNIFEIKYNQKYIGLNYYVLTGIGIIIIFLIYFFAIFLPKSKSKKEDELRKKILNEIEQKNN